MKTKQPEIVEEFEKVLNMEVSNTWTKITIAEAFNKALQSQADKTREEVLEEVKECLGDPDENFLEWRRYIAKFYESKSKKTRLVYSYHIWLDRKQRKIINKLKGETNKFPLFYL